MPPYPKLQVTAPGANLRIYGIFLVYGCASNELRLARQVSYMYTKKVLQTGERPFCYREYFFTHQEKMKTCSQAINIVLLSFRFFSGE